MAIGRRLGDERVGRGGRRRWRRSGSQDGASIEIQSGRRGGGRGGRDRLLLGEFVAAVSRDLVSILTREDRVAFSADGDDRSVFQRAVLVPHLSRRMDRPSADGGLLDIWHRVGRRNRRKARKVPGSGGVQQRGGLVRPQNLIAAVGSTARQSLSHFG